MPGTVAAAVKTSNAPASLAFRIIATLLHGLFARSLMASPFNLGCIGQSFLRFRRMYLTFSTKQAPLGRLHKQEIESCRDGDKAKISPRQRRKAQHGCHRAERQINSDRHR